MTVQRAFPTFAIVFAAVYRSSTRWRYSTIGHSLPMAPATGEFGPLVTPQGRPNDVLVWLDRNRRIRAVQSLLRVRGSSGGRYQADTRRTLVGSADHCDLAFGYLLRGYFLR